MLAESGSMNVRRPRTSVNSATGAHTPDAMGKASGDRSDEFSQRPSSTGTSISASAFSSSGTGVSTLRPTPSLGSLSPSCPALRAGNLRAIAMNDGYANTPTVPALQGAIYVRTSLRVVARRDGLRPSS